VYQDLIFNGLLFLRLLNEPDTFKVFYELYGITWYYSQNFYIKKYELVLG